MSKVLINPSKYVQGAGELAKLGAYAKDYGKKALMLISEGGYKRSGEMICEGFREAGVEVVIDYYKGNCTTKSVERVTALARENDCDVVIGVGGGTIMDTAKAVAHYTKAGLIIVPTAASTDAPCTGLVVVYSEEGAVCEFINGRNPDLVIMDTEVITKSPVRLTMSGIGDALSTYFEARACKASDGNVTAGGKSTLTAQAIAKLCYETLLSEGVKAKMALEAGVCTPAVEKIIEANSYMSGIGFESGGLGACHAVHNGLTVLEGCHGLYHGEKVAFGVVTQLMLEDADEDELNEIFLFLIEIGLPVTFEELGIGGISDEELMVAANVATAAGETIYNMPFEVSAQSVFAAMKAADAYGRMMHGMVEVE